MTIDDLTPLQLFYVALMLWGVVYFVVKAAKE
jgi:hypothetical protein